MPNIMITYRCNLHCPYCFANEFVNKSYTDMKPEDFRMALDFAVSGGPATIGLIGGEPTVHPEFETFLEMAAATPGVESVMLYTNGLLLDRYASVFTRPHIKPILKILINCNSPAEQGDRNYEKLKNNLDLLFGKYHLYQSIKLGVNLHNNDFDYSFMKELLVRYDQYQVRMSMTVPDFSECGRYDILENFEDRKQYLLDFYREMDSVGVLAYYDCNRPPRCVWTEEEWQYITWYRNKYRHLASNIADEATVCHPVIDILPDLQAVRCFGMSGMNKTKIEDFECLRDLRNYYENTVDCFSYHIPSGDRCCDCYSRKVKKCTGGCIGGKGIPETGSELLRLLR